MPLSFAEHLTRSLDDIVERARVARSEALRLREDVETLKRSLETASHSDSISHCDGEGQRCGR